MIYAYDELAPLPVKDLYDSQIMALAINSAREAYKQGYDEMKDFRSEYGNFMSPNEKDVEWYNKNFDVASKVNEIYARGGDPLRNPSDRGELMRWIYSRPIGDYNNRKLRASNLQAYYENKAKLVNAGKYDPDQEAFALMQEYGRSDDPSTWDFDEMGLSSFGRLSPVQAVSLKDATSDWFDKRQAHTLTKDEVSSFGNDYASAYDPNYDYSGYTYQNLLDDAGVNLPGWRGSFASDYFRDVAKRELQQRGYSNPTDQQVDRYLQKMVADANREYIIRPERVANKFALENIEHRHALQRQREAASYKSNSRGAGDKPFTSYGQTLFLRGVQNYSGSMDPGIRGLNIANAFGEQVRPLALNQRFAAYRGKYIMEGAESPQMFVSRFSSVPSRIKDVTTNGVNIDTSYDLKQLYSPEEVMSSTLGFPGVVIPTNRTALQNTIRNSKTNIEMKTTGNVYTAPMKNGSYEQFVEVDLDGNRYFYKVFESEPVPTSTFNNPNTGLPNLGASWDTTPQEVPYAPYGYSLIPSQNTTNAWGATDNAMNKAAGLASDQTHAGGSNYIDIQ